MSKIMYFKIILIAILLSSFSVIICNAQQGWIYPNSMVTESKDKLTDVTSAPDDRAEFENECNDVKRRFSICEGQLRTAEDNVHQQNPGMLILRHFKEFLRTLSDKFCLPKMGEHLRLNFKFSDTQCKSLSNFAEIPSLNPKDVEEIHHILENFTKNYEWVSDIQFPSALSLFAVFCQDNFYAIVTVMFTSLVVINSFWIFSNVVLTKRLVWYIIMALFFISIPWNWWHLYKKREAVKVVAMTGKSDPCGERSIWKRLLGLFYLHKDECTSHVEASLIHPAFEVTPIMAVSVTISRVFLEPLEYIGSGLNKFITAALGDLPILYQVTFGILIFVLVIVLVFLAFGYQFRTLFFTIGPSRTETTSSKIACLEEEKQELQNKLTALKDKLAAIEQAKESPMAISHSEVGSGDASTVPLPITSAPKSTDPIHNSPSKNKDN